MDARIRTGAAPLRTFLALAVSCFAAATPTPSRAADVSTSPGKVAVYETRDYWNKQITTTTIDGQILKAKPKQVLTITASAHSRLGAPSQQALGMYARLNGAYIEYSGFAGHCPQASNYCSVSGQWIVDLDAAEAAAPGTIMGHPLDVAVDFLEGFLTVAENVHLTMAVRMEKKR